VSATGVQNLKSYYSTYGKGVIDIAAPGGDRLYQIPDTPSKNGRILSTLPGNQYGYLQGTSMASPHAAGVGALIASRFGTFDRQHGGKTMSPNAVERKLIKSAAEHACPAATPECEGTPEFNGFYGNGIVDAYRAVR
jgi:subtilisin family serine protease